MFFYVYFFSSWREQALLGLGQEVTQAHFRAAVPKITVKIIQILLLALGPFPLLIEWIKSCTGLTSSWENLISFIICSMRTPFRMLLTLLGIYYLFQFTPSFIICREPQKLFLCQEKFQMNRKKKINLTNWEKGAFPLVSESFHISSNTTNQARYLNHLLAPFLSVLYS